jgi:tRNA threonylcarbamoyl adenosine modification protein (Sua5/YciO/YrdC/YwlC family)
MVETPLMPAGPAALAAATEALRAGSVVGIPTDTVYGLAVDPTHPGALERLFAMKDRPAEVAVPVLVGSWAQADRVADLDGEAASLLAVRFWPGPLTLVVPRAPGFTVDLGGPPEAAGSVGLRWPDHPVVAALCAGLGPLAVTSANLHGAPPAVTADLVVSSLAATSQPALVIDAGTCDRPPSTVVDCQGTEVRCLRPGTVAWPDIEAALEPSGGPGR